MLDIVQWNPTLDIAFRGNIVVKAEISRPKYIIRNLRISLKQSILQKISAKCDGLTTNRLNGNNNAFTSLPVFSLGGAMTQQDSNGQFSSLDQVELEHGDDSLDSGMFTGSDVASTVADDDKPHAVKKKSTKPTSPLQRTKSWLSNLSKYLTRELGKLNKDQERVKDKSKDLDDSSSSVSEELGQNLGKEKSNGEPLVEKKPEDIKLDDQKKKEREEEEAEEARRRKRFAMARKRSCDFRLRQAARIRSQLRRHTFGRVKHYVLMKGDMVEEAENRAKSPETGDTREFMSNVEYMLPDPEESNLSSITSSVSLPTTPLRKPRTPTKVKSTHQGSRELPRPRKMAGQGLDGAGAERQSQRPVRQYHVSGLRGREQGPRATKTRVPAHVQLQTWPEKREVSGARAGLAGGGLGSSLVVQVPGQVRKVPR